MDPFDLSGRSVLVTGGTRGIGAGIAAGFLGAGADVVVCGRREPAALPEVGGRRARFVPADVREPDQAARLVAACVELTGGLDVVVNNAGGTPPTPAADTDPRRHAKVIELNLLAPLHVAQAANAVLQSRPDGGSIIMIASVSGVRPSPGTAAYGAAKAGLIHLATSLAVEWAPRVRVNSVVVGLVHPDPAGGDDAVDAASSAHYGGAAGLAAVARTVPLGRMATARDVAHACLYLAGPAAGYVSGAALHVHGGGERPRYLDAAQGNG